MADYHVQLINDALDKARPNLERLKIWSTALKVDDLIQVKGDLYAPDCGGMCVLGVAFSTFFPERWSQYMGKFPDDAAERYVFVKDPFLWDHDLGVALEVENRELMLMSYEDEDDNNYREVARISSTPFYQANDDGLSLTEIADILDKYVASKA